MNKILDKKIFSSRFITTNDTYTTKYGAVEIPTYWWSRPYEYSYALNVVKEFFGNDIKNKICLDAASGLFYNIDNVNKSEYPLKFELAKIFQKVVCLDIDPDIKKLRNKDNIEYFFGKMGDFTYPQKFDCILCISVLEHCSFLETIKTINNFAKLLKNNGCLVVTLDYPSVSALRLLIIKKLLYKYFRITSWDFQTRENILNGSNSINKNDVYKNLNIFRIFAIKP